MKVQVVNFFTPRSRSTQKIQEEIREILKPYAEWKPSVNEYSAVGGGVQYPFNVNIMGDDLQQLLVSKAKMLTRSKECRSPPGRISKQIYVPLRLPFQV
jgi:hypothetical protein